MGGKKASGAAHGRKWVSVCLLCLTSFWLEEITVALSRPLFAQEDKGTPAPKCRRFRPSYPTHAHARGVQGYALLRFDIDARGKTTNIRIVSSAPAKFFDRSARRMASQLCYHPAKDADSIGQIVWRDVQVLFLYYIDRGCNLQDDLEKAAKAHLAARGIRLPDDITIIFVSARPPRNLPSIPCEWFRRRKRENR